MIYQIFSDASNVFDRAVVSDGECMAEVRLSEGYTAHIQTDTFTTDERADAEAKLEEVVEFVSQNLAKPDNTHVV